jgi:hypothetical protein
VLGAVGLLAPGLSRALPVLTPPAALGLVLIMIGAVAVTLVTGPAAPALIPLLVGCAAAFVGYGRYRLLAPSCGR